MHLQRWWLSEDDGRRLCFQHGMYNAVGGCPGCLEDIRVMTVRAIEQNKLRRDALEKEEAERASMWGMN